MKKAGNRQFSMAKSARPLAASRSLSQPLAASRSLSRPQTTSWVPLKKHLLDFSCLQLQGIDDSKTRGFQERMILRLDGVRLVENDE